MTDKEFIENIDKISADKLFETLEDISCDGYYYDIWRAIIEELKKRVVNAPCEERQNVDVLNKIPKDFVYDTETSEFYCYRNKYTGEEIHIIKQPKTYILADSQKEAIEERPKGEWEYVGMGIYECTNCKAEYEAGLADHCNINNSEFKYCPNCGADMRDTSIKGKCINCSYKTDTCQEGLHCPRD